MPAISGSEHPQVELSDSEWFSDMTQAGVPPASLTLTASA